MDKALSARLPLSTSPCRSFGLTYPKPCLAYIGSSNTSLSTASRRRPTLLQEIRSSKVLSKYGVLTLLQLAGFALTSSPATCLFGLLPSLLRLFFGR